MTNFSPKIEDSSDAELKQLINQTAPQFGSLASDELTRRSLKGLQETIEESNIRSAKMEKANYGLQLILIVLTIITTLVSLYPFFVFVLNLLVPILSSDLIIKLLSTIGIGVLAGILTGLTTLVGAIGYAYAFKKGFTERITISDNLNIAHTKSGK